MKKLKLVVALFSVAVLLSGCFGCGNEVSAQPSSGNLKSSLSSSVDSITCAGVTANYLYLQPSLSYKCASWQSNCRRKTGAMGGTLTLQGSNDNVTYVTTNAADTIHVTDGATNSAFLATPASTGLEYKYYRFSCVGLSGDTMYVHVTFNGR